MSHKYYPCQTTANTRDFGLFFSPLFLVIEKKMLEFIYADPQALWEPSTVGFRCPQSSIFQGGSLLAAKRWGWEVKEIKNATAVLDLKLLQI